MKGDFIEMTTTLYDFSDKRLPKEQQLTRMRRVIERELTEQQRAVLRDVYFLGKTQAEVARERGVCRSTVNRTLRRAEERLRRFLRY